MIVERINCLVIGFLLLCEACLVDSVVNVGVDPFIYFLHLLFQVWRHQLNFWML